jgi:ParB/RepB/Spo0J family partition protein
VTTQRSIPLGDIEWDDRYREDLGDITSLAASIEDKGVLQPITVKSSANGKYKGLAGFRRWTASGLAKIPEIPALVRDDQDDNDLDSREVELIENTYRKNFTWDEECALILEIDRLYKSKNFNWSGRKTAALLDKSVSGVAKAIQLGKACEIMPELRLEKTADDASKVIKKLEERVVVAEMRKRQDTGTGIKTGTAQMLRIANANYCVGDVFEGLAGLRNEGMIHIIECDPPYGIELNIVKSGNAGTADGNVKDYKEISKDAYPEFLAKLTKDLYRVASKDCWMIFWFGPTWHVEVAAALRAAGWIVDDIPGIWVKSQGQTLQPKLYLGRGYEPFFLCRKGSPVIFKRGRLNVFDFAAVAGQKKIHPTERPVALVQELFNTFGGPLSTVLVPFLGSGNSLRAAYNLGMKAFGFDLNDQYKDQFLLNVQADCDALDAEGE